jgi:hypothetical protein
MYAALPLTSFPVFLTSCLQKQNQMKNWKWDDKVENSELQLYRAFVFEEAGLFEEGLSHLGRAPSHNIAVVRA